MKHARQTVQKVQELYALLHDVQVALARYSPDANDGAAEFNAAWLTAEEYLREVIHPAELEAARQASRG